MKTSKSQQVPSGGSDDRLVRLLPTEDGTYFLRFSPDEHWLMTGIKGGKVYGRWIANGGGNRTPEQYPSVEWSRRYDNGEPEVYDATTDSMGAARNFAAAILPNMLLDHP